MTGVKRQYRSPRREAQARRTRERIVDAARRLWVERGFATTTMEGIAAEADVAVQTVYGAFGSKGAILTALLGRLEREAGGETLARELGAARTPRRQLALVAAFNRSLFQGGADIIAIALGSTAVDADVAAWAAEGDRRRREGQARIVAGWHAAGALRPEIGRSEARDVLYSLTSPEVYLLLVKTSGWPPGRYERWLDRTLSTLLLGGPA
jgi:TetR/AcrR family transcriptional regulator, regulator of cefoperazone and chloramphenicol sensitivity